MNLHEVKIAPQHDLFGDPTVNPQYWCSCGWRDFGITEHAIANGIIPRTGSLFYCLERDRGVCNRILSARGLNCGDHQLGDHQL